MELQQEECQIIESDLNTKGTTLENNASQESFEEVKTSVIDNNDDDQCLIVD